MMGHRDRLCSGLDTLLGLIQGLSELAGYRWVTLVGWLQGQSELAGYRWVTLVGWLQIGYTGGLASLRVGWLDRLY